MREILFRGKLKCNGEWVYGHLIIRPNSSCLITPDLITPDDTPLGRYGEVDPETVGQYTGLRDLTGKRIFEGDIVKECRKDRFDSVKVGEIIFFEEACEFLLAREFDGFGIRNYFDYVKIGNIYDNPELRVRTRNDNKFY